MGLRGRPGPLVRDVTLICHFKQRGLTTLLGFTSILQGATGPSGLKGSRGEMGPVVSPLDFNLSTTSGTYFRTTSAVVCCLSSCFDSGSSRPAR